MNFKTVTEAAQMLGTTRQILYRGIKDGTFPYLEVGDGENKRRLMDMDEVRPIWEAIELSRADTVSTKELAAMTGLSETRILKWVRQGVLPAVTGGGKGGNYRFSAEKAQSAIRSMVRK